MKKNELILVMDCCSAYELDQSFIQWLSEHELIQLEMIEEQPYIHYDQLGILEQYKRFHYELDINLEGIEAISHLLTRIQAMQKEMNYLANKIRFYEQVHQDI